MTLSQKLEYLRQRDGLSRYRASQLCGLHSDAFRRYERGEVNPSVNALKAISEYFQIPLSDLAACDPTPAVGSSSGNGGKQSGKCRKKKHKSAPKRERSTRDAISRSESEQRENDLFNSEQTRRNARNECARSGEEAVRIKRRESAEKTRKSAGKIAWTGAVYIAELEKNSRESRDEAVKIARKTSEKFPNKAERKRRECGIFQALKRWRESWRKKRGEH